MKQLRPHQSEAISLLKQSLGKGVTEFICDGVRWKQIAQSPRYWVSDQGDVLSTVRKWRILSSTLLTTGYPYVSLMVSGKPVKHTVHRLVASAFCAGHGEVVNHIDGNKLNNRAENLEWCSYRENNDHARDNNLVKNFGQDHYAAKLLDSDIPVIRRMVASGMLHRQVAEIYGVNRQQVTKIASGQAWRRA